MGLKYREHWLNLIRPLFMKDADLSIVDLKEEYEVVVSWKLGTDPSRPSKRSKTIRIIVSEEAVEDYLKKSERQRENDDEKLVQFIKSNLENIDPNHDNPIHLPRPEAPPWIAGRDILNS